MGRRRRAEVSISLRDPARCHHLAFHRADEPVHPTTVLLEEWRLPAKRRRQLQWAKIKADLVDRKIFISINGKEQTRRAFLAVIRSAFDEINSNFKIDIKQMIPVPGFPHVLVSYQDLLAYEEMNELQIFIPELRKKFSVRELLDGVEELSIRMERRERDLNERGFLQHG